jgi:hypothetical protein
MNSRLFLASILAFTLQMQATPSITLINDDPQGVCSMPDLIITYNDKVVPLSPGGRLTIPQTAQHFTVLRPLTNLIATDTYYKFQVTHISDDPETNSKALEVGSHSLIDFDQEEYSVTLDEHNSLLVKRDSEVVRLAQPIKVDPACS